MCFLTNFELVCQLYVFINFPITITTTVLTKIKNEIVFCTFWHPLEKNEVCVRLCRYSFSIFPGKTLKKIQNKKI